MSIANVVITPERALVAVDSNAATVEGVVHTTAKMFVCPAHGAVVAGRGRADVVASVGILAMLSAGDFDTLVADMPDLCRRAHAQSAMLQTSVPVGANNIMLAGWSPKQQRVCGWFFAVAAGSTQWSASEITQCCLGPDIADAWPESIDDLVAVARQQMQLQRDHNTGPSCGGAYRIAIVDRNEITIRVMADLGDY